MKAVKQPHRIFNDSWALYKKIVEADYMHHQLLIRLTLQAIEELKNGPGVRMLDIGCGDAEPVIPIIKKLPVTQYTGYDLSEAVLDKCASNLSGINLEFKLRQGDMATVIDQEEESFDLIFSSYAIHHLADDEKLTLLKKIGLLLKQGGLFIYIDIFRDPGQSLDQYRKDYNDYISQWIGLTAEEKSAVTDHINKFDFPATRTNTKNWISQAGLEEARFYRADRSHMFLALKKAKIS